MTMSADHYNETGIEFCQDQTINYNALVNFYSFGATVVDQNGNRTNTNDYIWLQRIGGVDYYCANNEDWGDIIAVHHTEKLCCRTYFYEMDAMAAPDSEDNMVVHNGKLTPKWEAI